MSEFDKPIGDDWCPFCQSTECDMWLNASPEEREKAMDDLPEWFRWNGMAEVR